EATWQRAGEISPYRRFLCDNEGLAHQSTLASSPGQTPSGGHGGADRGSSLRRGFALRFLRILGRRLHLRGIRESAKEKAQPERKLLPPPSRSAVSISIFPGEVAQSWLRS